MIFANIKSITIPEGKVKQIKSGTTLIWEKMEEEKIEVINLLPRATDTDRITIYGDDYNGDGMKDGYLKGKRLSSSGSVSTYANNMATTGFITSKVDDILRIKGAVIGAANMYVIAYDSSNTKTGYLGWTVSWSASSPTVDKEGYTYDKEKNIIEMPLSSAKFGTGFNAIRMCAGEDMSNVIITINQEITE